MYYVDQAFPTYLGFIAVCAKIALTESNIPHTSGVDPLFRPGCIFQSRFGKGVELDTFRKEALCSPHSWGYGILWVG